MNPDYNDEDPKISNAINSEDVNSISSKAKQIVEISKPIIEGQEHQLKRENEHSIKAIDITKLYKYFAFAQIIVTVFIGIIHLIATATLQKADNMMY